MKRATILCILLGFGLAGCGGSSQATTPTYTQTGPIAHNWGGYQVDTVLVRGHLLTCVHEFDSTNGGIAISCNWELFNKRGK